VTGACCSISIQSWPVLNSPRHMIVERDDRVDVTEAEIATSDEFIL
jgi:hypothetical protein